MTEAADWVRARFPEAPPALLEAMLRALPAKAATIAEALAQAALSLYTDVLVGGSGSRADALPLLAADALLTHAFEAQAEQDPDSLDQFVRRWGPAGRVGELTP